MKIIHLLLSLFATSLVVAADKPNFIVPTKWEGGVRTPTMAWWQEHPDGVSPLMAMEAVPAGGVRDDVNGRLGASMASV